MVETLCAAATVQLKAGSDVSSDLTAGNYTTFINQAEGAICAESKINWIDIYSTLNDDFKKILEDAASSHAAIAAIAYNMDGYATTTRVQTLLNVNYARFRDAMNIINRENKDAFISTP